MNLKEKLLTLPKNPGCYLMKDAQGKVIYVGKAINLKNRVNSYFIGAHNYKTTKLVSNIRDFDFILCKSEKEAFILEYNLIKEYNPKYNIVFKDDSSYPYILVKDCPEPYCAVVRMKKKSKYKGKLYGPYPDVTAARNVVALINKLFPTRKCDNLQNDICLYYHMHECLGYCRYKIDPAEVNKIREEIISLLEGNVKDIVRDLKKKMNESAEKLEFEQSSIYRDLINDINTTLLRQDVQKNNNESFDVFNYAVEDGYIAITGLFIRRGKLLSSHKYIDYLVDDPENTFSSYVYQFYAVNPLPKKLYLPKDSVDSLKENLETDVISVTRGYKYSLLKQAKLNSSENLIQNRNMVIRKENYIDNIASEMRRIFSKDISRIELFDNSHTSGKQAVAAMVVYKNYAPSKKDYRLYKLEDSADDMRSMKEVLYRRYFRVLKDGLERPDLIIVDGGRTQIEAAKEILSSLNMDITIVGLGKDDHHNTAYMMNSDFELVDIDKDSNLFFFLTNMQDEVHRFAIGYHKKLRSKANYRSVLDDVEGLGPKTKMKLLKKYRSVAQMRQLTLEELQTVCNKTVAEKLYNKLKETEDAEELK